MSARDILIRPIITEKSMRENADDNKVVFEVKKGANKTEYAQAIKEIYNLIHTTRTLFKEIPSRADIYNCFSVLQNLKIRL